MQTTNMTAETLKPFITPTTVDNYAATHSSTASSRCSRSCYFLAITASVITVILTTALLGIAIWNTMRISNLQTEVQNLNRVIESMQKRLGLTYLDVLRDFEKDEENNNTLIDDVLPDDDVDDDDEDDDDDDDDDEEYEDYEDLRNKFRHYQETEDEDEEDTANAGSLANDNLYDDFEKFNDSKLKHQHGERKTRSLVNLNTEQDNVEENTQNERQVVLRQVKDSYSKSFINSDNLKFDRRRSPLRVFNSRRRKFPLIKSGKTVAAISNPNADKPAAHFHITRKVPYHQHHVQITNHNGDVYIGKASISNELDVDNYFLVEHGVVTVREPGLYYVYAQICYNNFYPKNGYTIFHGDREFLQCLHHSHGGNEPLIITCHTSGLIYLRYNERLHIRDLHMNRMTFQSDKSYRSFFGLMKI